jgi:predicted Zn-dependent protease
MRGRRFPEAEAELRKIVAAHPEEATAHLQLGRVLAAENKNEDAIAELQTGAKIVPTDLSVQRDLADLYVSAGKYSDAESTYRTLIAAHPQDPDLHRGLGQTLMREKKFAEAEQELLTAVKLKSDFGAAYGDLAFAASENKNYPLTLKALDARAKLLPEIPITYFLRASAYDHLQDVKQARANYHLFLEAANGKYPDQEWQAKHRLIALEPKK